MKFLGALTAAIAKIWNFLTFILKAGIIGAIVLVALAITMPENAIKVIEILKGLIP